MHEMSLTESVVEILCEEAHRQGFSRVRTVWLEIGELSGVEPDAMEFCFDVVTRGTLAEGARLEIVRTAGQGWCLACEKDVALAERFGACPECGGHKVQMTAGDEMRVKELEVE
ncbi:hydrogenase maturation nickel metallochaperone HypA [Rhodoblastus acidophilus]|uniref:Hydrogenase maturation factor HypA n=1 Tax=Candidatus Rhodoblastus alkanivorans TaxID=2954117 RepID=A0ABS9Z3Q7_9HYPH|nr:hydrogenase maturation nickel metallochaperone HypA [Candidatus Rhodoblastus alkanivorans]MCI4677453.1 hydrogenase maturation nickel metallochaperone HypA [Candidatus Rhodoblastus alkanivorans]MCI4681812.1 hydrogenase maturation nickel metallochaperone HypA [Candidatus Rhodoblastus alkanivorans]MDI4642862.1 hydrogenase maturation nickel metallochaperone HypA [Rhodoblastus acidophilus]